MSIAANRGVHDHDSFISRVIVSAPGSNEAAQSQSTQIAEFEYLPRVEDAVPLGIAQLLVRCPRAECKKWVDLLYRILDPNELVRIRSMPVCYSTSVRAQELRCYETALLALPSSGAQAFEFYTTRPCGPVLLQSAMVPYNGRITVAPGSELYDLARLKAFVGRLAMAIRGPNFTGVTFPPNTLQALPLSLLLSHLNECVPLAGYLYSPSLRNLLLITQDHSVYCIAIFQGMVGKVAAAGVDLDLGLLGVIALGPGVAHPLNNMDICRLFPEVQEAFWTWRKEATGLFRLGLVYH